MTDSNCEIVNSSTQDGFKPGLVGTKEEESVRELKQSITCVFCGSLPADVPPKLLPCLHVSCQDCLEGFLTESASASPTSDGQKFATLVFSCPCCAYSIQIPREGLSGLKNVSFLLSSNSKFVTSINGLESESDRNVASKKYCDLGSSDLPAESTDELNSNSDSHESLCTRCDDGDRCREIKVNSNRVHTESSEHHFSNGNSPNSLHCDALSDVDSLIFMNSASSTGTKEFMDGGCMEAGCNKNELKDNTRNNSLPDMPDDHVSRNSDDDACFSDNFSRQNETEDKTNAQFPKLHNIISEVKCRHRHYQMAAQQINSARQHVDETKSLLQCSITQRAEYLCQLIYRRRDQLLEELDREHVSCVDHYDKASKKVDRHLTDLRDAAKFAKALISANDLSTELHEDVTFRLTHLLNLSHSELPPAGRIPEINDIHIDIPGTGHEESHLEKLFGTLVRGTVGTGELLMSFNTELHWPSGFVITRSHDSVLVGKAGAFASDGRAFFYDRHGNRINSRAFDSGRLPIDAVALSNGRVLISDVSGCISKFSSCGQLLVEWPEAFKGSSGHLAVADSNNEFVLVTSTLERCIHRYRTIDGSRTDSLVLQWHGAADPLEPHAIATNSRGDIIVTVREAHAVYFFSTDGKPLYLCISDQSNSIRTISSHEEPDAECSDGQGDDIQNNGHLVKNHPVADVSVIRLPSAICCDPFDNVLVADFMANCVHLVSRSGQYLGQLLGKGDGITCPNCMSLDQDGRLYVGQYGGDMMVYRYLSYVKHA